MTCDVRLARVLGLPAILGERVVGHVERVSLEPEGRRLRGLVIRRGLGGAKWIGREGVGVLGDVSVVLKQPPGRPPRDAAFTLGPVKDESGLTLGRVTDLWFSPETMEVTALEVTLGLIEDLKRGRLRVSEWAVSPDQQILIGRKEWEVQA